ncbi:unnamed protein product [Orchesella dallaii]|uniref:Copper type II ascorbate-dependent monooxygenase C-terminal domain-containing protein n=1 Tax=Orchesella dallaii TaxID=48710 RepID=A0ABP1PJE9_9HEXA
MLESHYDNPEVRSDLEIENGIDFEYTSQLRQDDGSLMYTGYGIPGLFAIPPESSSFNIVGHCSSYCTKEMLPSTGVQIHSLTLHAHTQARRMRLRHFRGNQELKWIINDDNYDYNYQVVRTLPEPVTILPGDQLTTECSFDNTGRNNSASSSGYSTKDEMCTTFYVINKKIQYLLCSSEYPVDTFMSRFGIQSLTWDVEKYERIVNSAKNSSIVGLTMGEVVGNWSSWSTEERVTWERELMYGKHNANCPNVRFFGAVGYPYIALLQTLNITAPFNDPDSFIGTPFPSGSVTYPVGATTYTPPNTCRNGEFATNGNANPSSIGVGVTGIPNAPIVTAGRLGFGSVVPSTIQNPPAVSVMRNTLSPPPPPLFR